MIKNVLSYKLKLNIIFYNFKYILNLNFKKNDKKNNKIYFHLFLLIIYSLLILILFNDFCQIEYGYYYFKYNDSNKINLEGKTIQEKKD